MNSLTTNNRKKSLRRQPPRLHQTMKVMAHLYPMSIKMSLKNLLVIVHQPGWACGGVRYPKLIQSHICTAYVCGWIAALQTTGYLLRLGHHVGISTRILLLNCMPG